MPKIIRTGIKFGTQYNRGILKCRSCGGEIVSNEDNCPHCGATRPADYSITDVKVGEKVTDPEEIKKIQGGAHNCAYCGALTWNYDAQKGVYDCGSCGANQGEKTDYEIGGGQSNASGASNVSVSNAESSPISSSPLQTLPWKKIFVGAGVLVALGFFIWLIVSLTTTHEVKGVVQSVSWERQSHQEEYQLLNGSGWDLPADATPVGTPASKYYGDQENVIGYTHGEYEELSTPEVVDYTYSTIQIETPGAISTTEPYICSEPTEEAGGYVSYDMCTDEVQADSTYGEGKSDPTPVYAPQVMVQMTTVPTPVYGTPTPIYKNWWIYTYWQWVNVGNLPDTSGHDNEVFWPEGKVDTTHRVVNDFQHYEVVIHYDNGKDMTYQGSDPKLLDKYVIHDNVIGYFNAFGGLNGDNK